MLIHHTQLSKSLVQLISLLPSGFVNNGERWSVTQINTHWLPLVCYITYSWVSSGLLRTVQWLLVCLVQSPWKRLFIVCCCSSHAWDHGVWTGSQWVHRDAEGVKESVKDSHPASFLKTSPQSRLSLCIVDMIESGRRVLSLESFNWVTVWYIQI